jgi:hypothetical protein
MFKLECFTLQGESLPAAEHVNIIYKFSSYRTENSATHL